MFYRVLLSPVTVILLVLHTLFSPVSIILKLHVALILRIIWRNLGIYLKSVLLGKSGSTGLKSAFSFLVFNFWTFEDFPQILVVTFYTTWAKLETFCMLGSSVLFLERLSFEDGTECWPRNVGTSYHSARLNILEKREFDFHRSGSPKLRILYFIFCPQRVFVFLCGRQKPEPLWAPSLTLLIYLCTENKRPNFRAVQNSR